MKSSPQKRRRSADAPAGLASEVPDPLEQVISLAEAAELSGLAAHTLTQQAKRSRLRARKVGHTWVTTRFWLDEYISSCAEHAAVRRR